MELEVGSIVEGKVTGITKFGAFVSLPGGRSGLVHISEIAYTYVNDVKDHLAEGQAVKVKIIGIDDNRRINLSIKQALPPPPRQERDRSRPPRREGGDRRERTGERSSRAAVFDPAPQARGPASFEDQLKQFMAASDSKLSELHMNERRGSRRGGGGRR